jgi:hypothetical protein
MLAFVVKEITRIMARKTYSAEGLQKLCSTEIEVERFLEQKYDRSRKTANLGTDIC